MRAWWTVAAMALANVIVTLDFFGVNVALPSIEADLGGGQATMQWIANAYMLTLAAPLLALGRLGDVVGRRRVVLGGLAVFGVGSLLNAAASDGATLVLGRAVTGLGASAITASSLALVSAAFPDARRGLAIGTWSAIGAVGAAVGPLVGGVVVQALSWRWLLGLGAPAAAVAATVTIAVVAESAGRRGRVDWLGAALVTAGLAAGVAALIEGPDAGWTDPAIVVLGLVSVLTLVSFVVVERRPCRTEPMVDLALFRRRSYLATVTVAFVANAAFAVSMFYVTLYLQQVRSLTPVETGLVFLAMTVPLMATSPAVGALTRRIGAAWLMGLGMALLSASFLALSLLGAGEGGAVAARWTLAAGVGLVLAGLGQSLAFNTSNVAAMTALDAADAGEASGLVSAVRQCGSLVGLAAAGALFQVLQRAAEARGMGDDASFVDALGPTMLALAVACGATVFAAAAAPGRAVRPAPAPLPSPVPAHPVPSGAR